jgi:hypothetical protein
MTNSIGSNWLQVYWFCVLGVLGLGFEFDFLSVTFSLGVAVMTGLHFALV